MTKIGRPNVENPRKNIVGCKLTDDELERLENYCRENDLSKSSVLKNGIKDIIAVQRIKREESK